MEDAMNQDTEAHYAYCPVKDCDYWVSFGGYFQPFIAALYKHYRKAHSKEEPGIHRVPGGFLDQVLGEAVLARLKKEPRVS